MSEELERKYLGVSADMLRPRLLELGATCLYTPHFESNVLYDSPDAGLLAKRQLLRIRTREWADRKESLVTFKIPLPDVMVGSAPAKRREETEFDIEDGSKMALILRYLGYFPRATYEKVRETWVLGAAHIDMDILPFMDVVEVEAPAFVLKEVEDLLGLDKYPTSAKSYHVLYLQWLNEHKMPVTDSFVFSPARRLELRKSLQLP